MVDKSFYPKYICVDCANICCAEQRSVIECTYGDMKLTICDICNDFKNVSHTSRYKKKCPNCKEMVPLSEWSFTPGKKWIRQKCDRCRKNEKYIKNPIRTSEFK